jgi:hypothetical protein
MRGEFNKENHERMQDGNMGIEIFADRWYYFSTEVNDSRNGRKNDQEKKHILL